MASGPEGGAATLTETNTVSPAQSRAAFAYARTLLDAEVAEAAAEDVLAAFRQAAPARPDDGGSAESDRANETLLALTRLMIAVSVPDRSSPADRRQAVWASIGQVPRCTCRESAALLATRANGNIQPRENTALFEHMAACADCRELSVRAAEAENAFRRELIPPQGPTGFGLPSVPRAAYGALGVLIAVIVAGVLVLSGNSTSNASRAAVAPVQTQASAALTAPVQPTKARKPVVKKPRVVVKKTARATVRKHVVHEPATTTPAADTTPAAGAAAAPASDTAAASGSAGTTNDTTGDATADSTPATTAGTSASSSSSAAEVSGSTSLPAASAPQAGIGSLTSTTP